MRTASISAEGHGRSGLVIRVARVSRGAHISAADATGRERVGGWGKLDVQKRGPGASRCVGQCCFVVILLRGLDQLTQSTTERGHDHVNLQGFRECG